MSNPPVVSIVVPNYNHARYLRQRLDGIVHQTFRDWELIVLDDASTDESMQVIERYTRRPNVRVVRNEKNSGSPFKQWLKGLALAQADIVWIAESDDASEANFLEALLPAFRRAEVRLAYANSTIIDEQGKPQGDYSKVEYLTSLSPTKWKRNYVASAADEVSQGFGVKNTILSASSVLFRKFALPGELRGALEQMRLAGDWLFFAHAMLGGSVWYDARPLNFHRRHKESVIATAVADKKLRDFFHEFQAVQAFIFEHYPLDAQFEGKWEKYLRSQWQDFSPGKPFGELAQYYPLEEMRRRIRGTAAAALPAPEKTPVPAPASVPAPAPRAARGPAPLLVIGHDAYRAGAQIVLLTLLREWRRTQAFPLRLILVQDGALRADYERICPTLVLSDTPDPRRRRQALEEFLSSAPRLIYSNTVANGPLLEELSYLGVPVVTHVHELQKSIERWAPGKIMASTLRCTRHFIAVSEEVAANLRATHRVSAASITTIAPFISIRGEGEPPADIAALRRTLGLRDGEIAVFGCGTIDWRKGPDLFAQIGARVVTTSKRVRFFWIGGPPELRDGAEKKLRAQGLHQRIHFLGARDDARECFAAGDVFLLSSREDPFPLVALEAADAGLPIVCFEKSGGMPAFVRDECGLVVSYEDVAAAATAIMELAGSAKLRRAFGAQAKAKVTREHSSATAAARVAAVLAEHWAMSAAERADSKVSS